MNAPHRGFFDLWSFFYDLPPVQRATYHPVHDAVLRALGRRAPGAILDVACGTGQLGARLRAAFPRSEVVGCDFSAGMLQHAAKRARGVGWVRADAGRLPFADGSFDALTCTEAFHWFPDQQIALAEFHRVLAPGGRALIALVNPRAALLSDIAALGSRLLGEPFRWPTRMTFRRALTAAGFRVLSQRSVGRLPGAVLFPAVLSVAQKRT
jgi:ubiquinone/menaquinone biosynthesis C-methylase UbiE